MLSNENFLGFIPSGSARAGPGGHLTYLYRPLLRREHGATFQINEAAQCMTADYRLLQPLAITADYCLVADSAVPTGTEQQGERGVDIGRFCTAIVTNMSLSLLCTVSCHNILGYM